MIHFAKGASRTFGKVKKTRSKMNTSQHQFLTDYQGVPLSVVLPISEYNDLIHLATLYSETEEEVHFSEEELKSIEISHQQAKEGKTISSAELHKRLTAKYGNKMD